MVYLPQHQRFTTRDFLMPQVRSRDRSPSPHCFLITKKENSGVIVPCIDSLGVKHAGHAFKPREKQTTKHIRHYRTVDHFISGKITKEGTTKIGPHMECKHCGMIRILSN